MSQRRKFRARGPGLQLYDRISDLSNSALDNARCARGDHAVRYELLD